MRIIKTVMGYTHYWYKKEELPQAQWNQFTDRLSGLFANSLVTCLESDAENLPPEINADEVRFNGKGVDGHETFRFTRVVSSSDFDYSARQIELTNDEEGRFFDCCKTAQKHYDYYVVRVLALAEDIFGSDVDVKSDGDLSEIKKTIESSDYHAQEIEKTDMKDYKIPVSWQMYGSVWVKAKNIHDAAAIAEQDPDIGLPTNGTYVEASWEVDWEIVG